MSQKRNRSISLMNIDVKNPQQNTSKQGFHGGTVVENLPASAGDVGSSPGLGRSHMMDSN